MNRLARCLGVFRSVRVSIFEKFPQFAKIVPNRLPNLDDFTDISKLEAVLFLLKEPASARRLAQLAGLSDGAVVQHLISELNRRYESQSSAFGIVEVAGGCQLRTLPEFAPWLFRLQEIPVEVRLSSASMETLSIIAYEQPILRVKIEQIRGVSSGEILKQLLEHDLIRIVGRSEELGRPFLYGTTKRFLQLFGLVTIADLPRKI